METIKDWDRALLFTGQGIQPEDVTKYASQLRDVDGELLEANVDRARKASNLPIARYLVNPTDIFSNNVALQMVVHTLNVTAGDLAIRKIGTTEGLVSAGHSLGEVASFDIARVFLHRNDGMEFVYTRASNMQEDHEQGPGSLYRIDGLTEEQVEEIGLELEIVPALINAPRMIVVASSIDRTDIEEPAKKAGARRVLNLKIPAFHSFYMDVARGNMADYIGTKHYRNADFPVVSNLDAEGSLEGGLLVANHNVNFTNPVRWRDVIATILHPGVTFYTLGPSNNLSVFNSANEVPKEQTKDLFDLLAE